MRFSDNNIRITIREIYSGRVNSFKAYLEDVDVSFAMETQKIEFASMRSQANEMVTKTTSISYV